MRPSVQNFIGQEEAIIGHLFWAAEEIEIITVQVGPTPVSGRLLAPDAEVRAVVFDPSPGQLPVARWPSKGKIVRVRYASLVDSYAFQCAVIETSAARWKLTLPRQIDRTDRRIVQRRTVINSRRFTVQLHDAEDVARHLLIYDISPVGFSFEYDPKLDWCEEGRNFRGTLHMPGAKAMDVRFEVESVRVMEEESTLRIAGCRFIGLGFAGCQRVARVLGEWA